jgi:hypothetical protein
MRSLSLSALLCALIIGLGMSFATAQSTKQSVKAGCHIHGKTLCCPGGCIDPKRKDRTARSPRGCHWHGSWVCCPGFDCINTEVLK